MNDFDQYLEDDTDALVFGQRSYLVPGRKVEIGYSVRKKVDFPLVEEMILKILHTVGKTSLDELVIFSNFTLEEMECVIRPLLRMGFIGHDGEMFYLAGAGVRLFAASEDGKPSIMESESKRSHFLVDDFSGLPVDAGGMANLGNLLRTGRVKNIIDDLQVKLHDKTTVNERVIHSFSEHFSNFLRGESDLEKIRDEKLQLHKTEYAKTTESFLIPTDVLGVIRNTGMVEHHFVPFDSLKPRSDIRQEMRREAIETSQLASNETSTPDLEFFRKYFGQDFLKGCNPSEPLAWTKIVDPFFKNGGRLQRLESGAGVIIGESSIQRNLALLKDISQTVRADTNLPKNAPLRIIWIRPAVESWGRSLTFLNSIQHILTWSKELHGGAVQLELWANWIEDHDPVDPPLRFYRDWFANVRVFRSKEVPPKTEMLLIGNSDGLILTHAFTPPQSRFPCPIGVCFEQNEGIRRLIVSEIEPKLRSLPSLPTDQKASKRTAKKPVKIETRTISAKATQLPKSVEPSKPALSLKPTPAPKPTPALTLPVTFPTPITVKDLADRLRLKPFQVIAELMEMNIFKSVNGLIEKDTVAEICKIHGFTLQEEQR